MQRDEWRLVVKLKSRRALQEFVDFHNLSVRKLSARAKRPDGTNVKPAIIGHLLSGKRATCSLATARAIEEALACPSGFLFDADMSRVADNPRRNRTAA